MLCQLRLFLTLTSLMGTTPYMVTTVSVESIKGNGITSQRILIWSNELLTRIKVVHSLLL